MIAYEFQNYPENFAYQLFIILQYFSLEIGLLLTVAIVFSVVNKTLRLNNLKTRTAMNVKISVFVNCVEAVIYLLLHNQFVIFNP